MKNFLFLLITFSVSFSASCARPENSQSSQEVIVINDSKTGAADEITIDDSTLAQTDEYSSEQRQREGYQEVTKISADNSRITTMYDGSGNKTETRFFDNNPLLLSITVRTSATGEKSASAYAQNGSVSSLPDNIIGNVLTASANDLAAAAGVYEGRREPQAPTVVQNSQPLQPMPSYKFPIQTPQPPPVEAAQTAVSEPVETPSVPTENKTAPPPVTEKLDSKVPPNDLK